MNKLFLNGVHKGIGKESFMKLQGEFLVISDYSGSPKERATLKRLNREFEGESTYPVKLFINSENVDKNTLRIAKRKYKGLTSESMWGIQNCDNSTAAFDSEGSVLVYCPTKKAALFQKELSKAAAIFTV